MWTATSSGHEIGLVDGRIRCRTKAGKMLATVPSALKADPAVLKLTQLIEWLARHDVHCRAEVERWMVNSLPVPLAALVQLWPDPSWQRALKDLIVRPAPLPGALTVASMPAPGAEIGLLRAVDAEQGVELATPAGDSIWVGTAALSIPHPALLPNLDVLRNAVAGLGVEQTVQQVFREVYQRPATIDVDASRVGDWSGGRFPQLRHLTGRAASLGYLVRGGFAAQKIFEAGRTIEALVWLGSGAPDVEAETGSLGWRDGQQDWLPLAEVGPVAWSEGARMAAGIFAGRVGEV